MSLTRNIKYLTSMTLCAVALSTMTANAASLRVETIDLGDMELGMDVPTKKIDNYINFIGGDTFEKTWDLQVKETNYDANKNYSHIQMKIGDGEKISINDDSMSAVIINDSKESQTIGAEVDLTWGDELRTGAMSHDLLWTVSPVITPKKWGSADIRQEDGVLYVDNGTIEPIKGKLPQDVYNPGDGEYIARRDFDPATVTKIVIGDNVAMPYDCSNIFSTGFTNLEEIENLSALDMSRVDTLVDVIKDTKIKNIEIDGWDLYSLNRASNTFDNKALKTLSISNVRLGGSLSNKSKSTSVYQLVGNTEMESVSLKNFTLDNNFSYSFNSMFSGAKIDTLVTDDIIQGKNVSALSMFRRSEIGTLDISKWNVSGMTTAESMFEDSTIDNLMFFNSKIKEGANLKRMFAVSNFGNKIDVTAILNSKHDGTSMFESDHKTFLDLTKYGIYDMSMESFSKTTKMFQYTDMADLDLSKWGPAPDDEDTRFFRTTIHLDKNKAESIPVPLSGSMKGMFAEVTFVGGDNFDFHKGIVHHTNNISRLFDGASGLKYINMGETTITPDSPTWSLFKAKSGLLEVDMGDMPVAPEDGFNNSFSLSYYGLKSVRFPIGSKLGDNVGLPEVWTEVDGDGTRYTEEPKKYPSATPLSESVHRGNEYIRG